MSNNLPYVPPDPKYPPPCPKRLEGCTGPKGRAARCLSCHDAALAPTSAEISAQRKGEPVYSGVYMYFPRALRAISRVSRAGNEKWNPGEPLRWAKEKSTDQPDCVARHQLTPYEIDPDSGERHLTHAAWRTLAWLETALEAVERGICTWDDLESGRVAVRDLGPKLAGKK